MKNIITFLSMAVVLMACSGEEETGNIQLAGTAIKVEAQSIANKTATLSSNFLLNGMVSAKESATISTRVMGNITQVFVKEGQSVRKGQVLAQVNNMDLKAQKARINAQIAEAEAAFKNAEKNYQRFKNLYESKSITQKEFNDVEMQYEMSQTRVTAAKEALNEINVQLGYASVTAPFNGRITQKMATQGNMANPGMPLFRIESAGNLLITVHVPASEIKHIKLKDEVSISIPDLAQELKGQVSLINPSSTHNGNQYKVEITPSSNPTQLLAGMNAKITFTKSNTAIETANKRSSIWVPKSALIQKGQLDGLYTISNQNTALLRWVQLGEQTADKAEVLSGLNPDDQVIIKAEGRLYNGVKITQ